MAPPASINVGQSGGGVYSPTLNLSGALVSMWVKRGGYSNYGPGLLGFWGGDGSVFPDGYGLKLWLNCGTSGQVSGIVYAQGWGSNLLSFTDTVSNGERDGWIGIAMQIVCTSASSTTIRIWRKYGTGGSIVGPATVTTNVASAGVTMTAVDHITIPSDANVDESDITLIKAFSRTDTPSNTEINDYLNQTASAGSPAAWWEATWRSGAAVLSDSSGNGRNLTAINTLYEGAEGPLEISSGVSLSASAVSASSDVSAPALGQTHVLSAASVAGTAAVSSPAIGQLHVLSPNTQFPGTAAVSTPAISQVHTLSAGTIAGAFDISAPAVSQVHALTASAVSSTAAVTAPAVSQLHTLAVEAVSASSTVNEPAIGQTHTLLASNLAAVGDVSAPALGQTHALAATSPYAASSVGAPAISQLHTLSAGEVSASSYVDAPVLAAEGQLSAAPVSASASVSAPALGQTHVLTVAHVSAYAAVSSPAIGQLHTLSAGAVYSEAAVSAPSLTQTTDLAADPVSAEASVSVTALAQVHTLVAHALSASAALSASVALSQLHVLVAGSVAGIASLSTPSLNSSDSSVNATPDIRQIRMAQKIDRQLKKHGEPITVRRYAVTRNPTTGDVSKGEATLSEIANAIEIPVTKQLKDTFAESMEISTLSLKTVRAFKVSGLLGFRPEPQDEITLADSSVWPVVGCTTVRPAGVDLIYTVGVAK